MIRPTLAIAIVLTSVATLVAAPATSRLRGSLSVVSLDQVKLHSIEGKDIVLSLNAQTKYFQIIKSGINEVDKDSYIGVATKTVGSKQVALGIQIFPASMKGVGEGHYSWDDLRDTTLTTNLTTKRSITNGNVTSAPTNSNKVSSSMTNGNVKTAFSKGGIMTLTITYAGGEQTIIVPSTAPIVAITPGTKSDLKVGASVFIQTKMDGNSESADFVAIGIDGVVPPV